MWMIRRVIKRTSSSSSSRRSCFLLVLVGSALSWVTLYTTLAVVSRARVCCLLPSFGLSAHYDDNDNYNNPQPRQLQQQHGDSQQLLAGQNSSPTSSSSSRPESMFQEYGQLFETELLRDIEKFGKKRLPAYGFPPANVGILFNASVQRILCEMKRVPPFLLTDETPPFDANPLGKYLHHQGPMLNGTTFKTCACVSSSGLLKGKKLGKFIDSHDVVLRMNLAPVVGYEEDVGSKTTIRILNNSVLRWIDRKNIPAKKKPWEFADSVNATLLVWEACAGRGPFTDCLVDYLTEKIKKTQGESMQSFFRWRKQNMDRELYYLNPDWLWSLWDLLQLHTPASIVGHVPTTGFIVDFCYMNGYHPKKAEITMLLGMNVASLDQVFRDGYSTIPGFAFLMHFCDEVNVFELIPSVDYRERQPCYYYDDKQSDFCYMNGYHPKKAEITMLLGMNVASLDQVFRDGYSTIPAIIVVIRQLVKSQLRTRQLSSASWSNRQPGQSLALPIPSPPNRSLVGWGLARPRTALAGGWTDRHLTTGGYAQP
ncbi:unnamed protein product [Notodromas monacha]|uniref:beta-galactoside alpha-(2,6)-sialyltransferase n=1 Tax=Notodromas monacha TaxID=399045 RepID=A0A7R9GHD9_9CRUS|nr:unnamed protein product [Notodromas monacha]CAG0921361.1 unnamed protein product [Notodromas monacha]